MPESQKIAEIIPLTRIKCPICKKRATTAHKPFCSKRCADIDLGKWLGDGYRIPTDEEASLEDYQDGEPEA